MDPPQLWGISVWGADVPVSELNILNRPGLTSKVVTTLPVPHPVKARLLVPCPRTQRLSPRAGMMGSPSSQV